MMIRIVPLAVLVTLLLPPASYVATTASSGTIGLLLSALGWLLVCLATDAKPYVVKKSEAHTLAMLLGLFLLLAVHVVISNLQLGGVNFNRFFISCFILAVLVMSARFAARKVSTVPVEHLVQAADLALVTMTLIAIAAVLGAPAIGPQGSPDKPVVIFAEPSHFSLAYVPILMFRVAISKPSTQVLLTLTALAIAALLQSLIMIVGIMLVMAVLLRRTPLLLMLLVMAAGLATLDLTYYSSRLVFSSESSNLSALVLLQGWERAILSFKETAGMGVGFQQFGIVGPIGEFAEKVATILKGEYINLLDGGSTATKLIGEFGILGIVGLLFFLRLSLRAVRQVRRAQQLRPQQRDIRALFCYSFVITYLIELFLRGTGYFSPGGFLTLIALFTLASRTSVPRVTSSTSASAIPTANIAASN